MCIRERSQQIKQHVFVCEECNHLVLHRPIIAPSVATMWMGWCPSAQRMWCPHCWKYNLVDMGPHEPMPPEAKRLCTGHEATACAYCPYHRPTKQCKHCMLKMCSFCAKICECGHPICINGCICTECGCVWLREDQLRPSAEPVQPASSHEGDEATDVCGDKGCAPTASPSSSDGAPAG